MPFKAPVWSLCPSFAISMSVSSSSSRVRMSTLLRDCPAGGPWISMPPPNASTPRPAVRHKAVRDHRLYLRSRLRVRESFFGFSPIIDSLVR